MKKKLCAFIASIAISISMITTAVPSSTASAATKSAADVFDDIYGNEWYADYVTYAYKHYLMTGMTQTIFSPQTSLSRAQFAMILYRMMGSLGFEGESKFPDVEEGTWYYDSVNWAAETGIVTGYESGYFGPGDIITREQFATMLYRYATFIGLECNTDADLSAFRDAAKVSGFADAAIRWCVSDKIITGKTATTLVPQGECSRAECATMLQRFITSVTGTVSDDDDYDPDESESPDESENPDESESPEESTSPDESESPEESTSPDESESPEESSSSDESGTTTDPGYHIHAGGLQIPHWLQNDIRWATETYGDSTLAANACGPTAMAMVRDYLTGDTVTPYDICKEIGTTYWVSSGTTWGFFTKYPAKHGFNGKSLGTSISQVYSELEAGHPVIMSARQGTVFAINSGHFIVLRGVTEDGMFMIVDPSTESRTNTLYTEAQITGAVKCFWSFWKD